MMFPESQRNSAYGWSARFVTHRVLNLGLLRSNHIRLNGHTLANGVVGGDFSSWDGAVFGVRANAIIVGAPTTWAGASLAS